LAARKKQEKEVFIKKRTEEILSTSTDKGGLDKRKEGVYYGKILLACEESSNAEVRNTFEHLLSAS
jgi:hypothetical protein